MATTSGNRISTQTYLLDGINSQRLFGFDGEARELVKNQAMFLAVWNKIRKMTVGDPDYKYVEHRDAYLNRPSAWVLSQTGTVTGVDLTADLSAATALTVFPNVNLVTAKDGSSASEVVKVGMTIQLVGQSSSADVPTQTASFYVKAPTTAATGRYNLVLLNAAPGFNAVTTSGATRSKIYAAGTLFGEGSEAATASYDPDVTKWASCEITKTRFTISNTVRQLVLAGNMTEARKQYKRAMARHDADLERKALYVSARSGATAGDPFSAPLASGNMLLDADGNPIRTSVSLLQSCKASEALTGEARVFSTSSSSTYSTVLTQLKDQFKWGSSTKWAFVGDGFLKFVQDLAWGATPSQFSLTPNQNVFGIDVTVLHSAFGDLNLVRDRTLTQDGFYSNSMFVVDPENCDLLVYRDTFSEELPTTKDVEDMQFLSEIGLAITLPETHGFWYYA